MHSTYLSAYPIGMIWPGVWIHWTASWTILDSPQCGFLPN